MTRNMLVLTVASLGLSLVSPAFACGDKFLLPVRGSRFQQAPVNRIPASVLLYANPASPLLQSLNRLAVDGALRKAGYRPTTVGSPDEFARAINQSTWDVIVLDVRDRTSLPARVQGRTSTVVVPVAQNATGEEIAAARKEYAHLLKSPSRGQSFVDAIDDALAAREHASQGR